MAVTVRDARPEDAEILSALAIRSKAYWGYGHDFMAACVDELTLSRRDIADWVVRVRDNGGVPVGYYQLRVVGGIAEIEQNGIESELCSKTGKDVQKEQQNRTRTRNRNRSSS